MKPPLRACGYWVELHHYCTCVALGECTAQQKPRVAASYDAR